MFHKIASHYGLDLQIPARGGENVEISLETADGPLSYRSRVQLKKK